MEAIITRLHPMWCSYCKSPCIAVVDLTSMSPPPPPGVKSPQSASAFVPTPEAGPYQPQAAARPSPSIDAKQQLQRKIHMKQQEQRLTSPPPAEGPARRTEEGAPPAGRALLGARPAHPSPQPPLGLVVATVQSPLTVQSPAL